jgi:DNA-binding IclR family transcriptional regulator
MGAEKHLRDVQILNLVMRGMKLGRIATQLGLHRNTVSKILQKPEIQELLDKMQKELVQRVTTDMIERHEAVHQATREERGRKRVLRRGQGMPLPREHNPLDPYEPIKRYLAQHH